MSFSRKNFGLMNQRRRKMSQNKESGTRIKGINGSPSGYPKNPPRPVTHSHQPTARGSPAEKPPSNPPNKGSAGKR